jgi:hypothetical protein
VVDDRVDVGALESGAIDVVEGGAEESLAGAGGVAVLDAVDGRLRCD